MKTTLFLAFFLLNSAWALPTQALKTFDGSVAYCKNKIDSYENRYGVYQLIAKSSQVIDQDFVEIDLELKFLNCNFVNGDYSFQLGSPFKSFFQKNYNPESSSGLVKVDPKVVMLKAFKDAKFKIVYAQRINKTNEAKQSLKAIIPISDLLTQGQLTAYELGEKVNASLDFYIQKYFHFTDLDTQAVIHEDFKSFGSYRVFIKL